VACYCTEEHPMDKIALSMQIDILVCWCLMTLMVFQTKKYGYVFNLTLYNLFLNCKDYLRHKSLYDMAWYYIRSVSAMFHKQMT